MISLFSLATPALACGGFFCNSATPVLQNAERVVFAVDEGTRVVETHVQVTYQGEASEFAWIVPVQSEPELFLSNDMLFNTVATQLAPSFQMIWEDEGKCKHPFRVDLRFGAEYTLADASNDVDAGGVSVVGQASVGPYATVTLQAESIDALMTWLADNDYAIPSTAAAALAPYISNEGYFVALKLNKGRNVGDLAPLGLRYHGTRPAVPIQLTSVAAADDLRLEVSVFGSRRAVPESYLHVVINDAAIDWFGGGQNYMDVITRAADEAGGHAFATDYAGSTDVLFANFAVPDDVSSLRSASNPTAWIQELQALGFGGSADMLALFQAVVPVREGLVDIDVYNCPSCYNDWYAGTGFDASSATDALVEQIVVPRRHVDELIQRYPYVTRMTSSLSASEMTVDPTFTFTDAMGDVDLFRTATLVWECNGKYSRKSDRRLELPDGHVIHLPSQKWFEQHHTTESEYLAELGSVNAVKIERTSSTGSVLIADFTPDVGDQINAFNGALGGGCGCQSAASGALPGLLGSLFLLLGLRRRG